MNKNDLIASVASSAGLSKSDATRAIESLLDAVTNSLKRDEKVSIVGFGNFSVSHRKATTGRNPRTGESIQIPASKKLSIDRVASDLDKPADEATEAIKSFLFTLDSFNYFLRR